MPVKINVLTSFNDNFEINMIDLLTLYSLSTTNPSIIMSETNNAGIINSLSILR